MDRDFDDSVAKLHRLAEEMLGEFSGGLKSFKEENEAKYLADLAELQAGAAIATMEASSTREKRAIEARLCMEARDLEARYLMADRDLEASAYQTLEEIAEMRENAEKWLAECEPDEQIAQLRGILESLEPQLSVSIFKLDIGDLANTKFP